MAQNNPPPPATTIPPFGNRDELPQCAVSCGILYEANGACVPPALPTNAASVYEGCFCNYPAVAAFRTSGATAGVCEQFCDSNGASSIAQWFTGLCNISPNGGGNDGGPAGVPATPTLTNGGMPTGDTSGSNGGSSNSNNGDWISNHWQWVVMIVILIVGIAAIWIGACIWRRRYLRRKDRQSTLGQKQSGSAAYPSWGPGLKEPEAASAGHYAPRNETSLPVFTSSDEKPRKEKQKKKWTVTQRT